MKLQAHRIVVHSIFIYPTISIIGKIESVTYSTTKLIIDIFIDLNYNSLVPNIKIKYERRFSQMLKNELQGIISWVRKNQSSSDQSRQYPYLDISQMNEDQEIRLIVPKDDLKTPKDCLGIWIWTLAWKPHLKEMIRLELEERSRRFQYKGLWMLLHKTLKLNSLDLVLYTVLESGLSGRELRGNILPNTQEVIWCFRLKLVYKPNPVYPEFHRGYRDKGSRRLDHEIHEDFEYSGPNPTKLDFSNNLRKSDFLLNFLYG